MKAARLIAIVLLWALAADVCAQSSSLFLRAQERELQAALAAKASLPAAEDLPSDIDRTRPLNRELEEVSLIAVRTQPPHRFKIHDLVTVIVREQKSYEGESRLKTQKQFQVTSKLDEFLRFLNGHLAAASFTDGQPNIDFDLKGKLDNKGDAERTDKLTLRMTVEILDIKPNGLLVLAGRQRITNDEELQIMSFTGTCRSRDVTADNTILSTQVSDQVIEVQHKGALHDSSRRGWLLRVLETISPF